MDEDHPHALPPRAGSATFNDWLDMSQRYYGRRLSVNTQDVYRKVLAHIPIADLDTMFYEFVADNRDDSFPRASRYVARYRSLRSDRRQHSSAPAVADLADLTPLELARRQLFSLVSRALYGSKELVDPEAPEFVMVIARYVRQRWATEHPGEAGTASEHGEYYAFALEMFNEESKNQFKDDENATNL